jgi:hypothetical protein
LIFVSKDDSATDTRTGLSKYDPYNPYATLTKAQTDAVSGDTIVVLPGVYSDYALGKDGVNWYFYNGAIVNGVSAIETYMWGDNGTAMTYSVGGYGQFNMTLSEDTGTNIYGLLMSNVNSNIIIYGLSLDATIDNYEYAGAAFTKEMNWFADAIDI